GISPDARHLAYLAPLDGVLNIWVAPVDSSTQARPVTHTRQSIVQYMWAYNLRDILYLQDEDGNEKWNIYRVPIDGSAEPTNLTPNPKVSARFCHVSHRHPDSIIVTLNDRDERYHDAYRIDLRTGGRTLIQKHPEKIGDNDVTGFIFDEDYKLRF